MDRTDGERIRRQRAGFEWDEKPGCPRQNFRKNGLPESDPTFSHCRKYSYRNFQLSTKSERKASKAKFPQIAKPKIPARDELETGLPVVGITDRSSSDGWSVNRRPTTYRAALSLHGTNPVALRCWLSSLRSGGVAIESVSDSFISR